MFGLALSARGVWRAFARGHIYRGKVVGSLSVVFSLALASLFIAYIFYLSYLLPEPNSVTAKLQSAPEFALKDHEERLVRLSDFRGQKVVLSFYRAHY